MPPKRRPTPRPRPLREDPAEGQIARINELTRVGRTNWFALLAYQTFAFITILGVEDADFFIDSRQTQLPLIGVEIPTFSFFIFAPALGAALYIYLHLHIRKLIDALTSAELPTGGKPLEERLSPWLFTDTILHYRAERDGHDALIQPRRMDWLVRYTTVLLVWVAGPAVQALFWWRTIPANSEWVTIWIGLLCGVAAYVGLENWRLLKNSTARRSQRNSVSTPSRRKSAWGGAFIVLLSWLATEGGVANYTDRVLPAQFSERVAAMTPKERKEFNWRASHYLPSGAKATFADRIADAIPTLSGGILDFPPIKISPFSRSADFEGYVFAKFDPIDANIQVARHRYRREWCDRHSLPIQVCGRYPSNRFELPPNQSLRRAEWCGEKIPDCPSFFSRKDKEFINEWDSLRASQRAALTTPDLSNRDLRGANLQNAELTGVNLSGSLLSGANLRSANLEGADFSRANLTEAVLAGARMADAKFNFAGMERIDLNKAQMEGAEIRDAYLKSANLKEANLQRADLTRANLILADATRAKMQRVILVSAELPGTTFFLAKLDEAILAWTKFLGTDLGGAKFTGADWLGADLQGAVFKSAVLLDAKNLTQAQLSEAVSLGGDQLPAPIRGQHPLEIPTCWSRKPSGWSDLLEALRRDTHLHVTRSQAESLICR